LQTKPIKNDQHLSQLTKQCSPEKLTYRFNSTHTIQEQST